MAPNRRDNYRGRKVLALAALLVLAGGCSTPQRGPGWEVRQDPNGLGYWAGPPGGPQRFYPSAYSNPIVSPGGGPAR